MYLRVAETPAQVTADPAVEKWELLSLSTTSWVTATLHTTDATTVAVDPVTFEVRLDVAGRSGGQQASFAYVGWLGRRATDSRARALECAWYAQTWPRLREISGVVRILVGQAANSAVLALVLATDTPAIDLAVRTVKSAHLVPGQDPALRAAPDDDGIYAVSPLHSATTATAYERWIREHLARLAPPTALGSCLGAPGRWWV